MKKTIISIALLFLLVPHTFAKNYISSVDMDIYVDEVGTAHVTEVWDTTSDEDTEFYKPYENIGTSKINNLVVKNQDRTFTTLSSWNIDSSFSDKAYNAGINYTKDGLELCMGISKYGDNTYIITYDISDFIVNLTDSQMLYWTLMPKDMSPAPNVVYIKIYSDFEYSSEWGVWGYGNLGGRTVIYEGYIDIAKANFGSSQYITVLAQFPSNTFNLSKSLKHDFNHYLDIANNGSMPYEKSNFMSLSNLEVKTFLYIFFILLITIIFIWGFFRQFKIIGISKPLIKYEKLPNEVEYFREIPCDKDIFKAYFISKKYNLMRTISDFLGVILLKWLIEKKVEIVKSKTKLLKKNLASIKLYDGLKFDIDQEKVLYGFFIDASRDNLLEKKEFKKWCKKNSDRIVDWFYAIDIKEENLLVSKDVIKEERKSFFTKSKYIFDSSIKEDGIKLKGLKNYLNDFSKIGDKKALEVNTWEYYLIYAQIFGIAKKVAKDLKTVYPELVDEIVYDNITFANYMSDISFSSGYKAAYINKNSSSSSSSYTSGGGGFSSGGGGGGSFGGGSGGGGSR